MVGNRALLNNALIIDPTDKDVNAEFITHCQVTFRCWVKASESLHDQIVGFGDLKRTNLSLSPIVEPTHLTGPIGCVGLGQHLVQCCNQPVLDQWASSLLVRQHDAAMVRAGLRQAHKITDIVGQQTTSAG